MRQLSVVENIKRQFSLFSLLVVLSSSPWHSQTFYLQPPWRCCSSFSCCHTLAKVSKVLISLYFLSLSTLTVSCVAVSPPAWSSSCLLVEGSCDGWPAVLFVGAKPVLRRCCRLHGCARSIRRTQGPQMTHWKPTPMDRLVLSLNLIYFGAPL